jgi:hypothetical protein
MTVTVTVTSRVRGHRNNDLIISPLRVLLQGDRYVVCMLLAVGFISFGIARFASEFNIFLSNSAA